MPPRDTTDKRTCLFVRLFRRSLTRNENESYIGGQQLSGAVVVPRLSHQTATVPSIKSTHRDPVFVSWRLRRPHPTAMNVDTDATGWRWKSVSRPRRVRWSVDPAFGPPRRPGADGRGRRRRRWRHFRRSSDFWWPWGGRSVIVGQPVGRRQRRRRTGGGRRRRGAGGGGDRAIVYRSVEEARGGHLVGVDASVLLHQFFELTATILKPDLYL